MRPPNTTTGTLPFYSQSKDESESLWLSQLSLPTPKGPKAGGISPSHFALSGGGPLWGHSEQSFCGPAPRPQLCPSPIISPRGTSHRPLDYHLDRCLHTPVPGNSPPHPLLKDPHPPSPFPQPAQHTIQASLTRSYDDNTALLVSPLLSPSTPL